METHPIEYIDIPRATFCTPNVASFGLTEEQAREQDMDVVVGKVQYGAVGAGTVYGDRGGADQGHRRQEVRRARRRAHRRREGDRADPGARQREGARGRLRRGGADRPRAPDAVGGRDGGRACRRRLAHPRLSTAALLLRPRLTRVLPRGRARAARARHGAGVDPGRPRRAGVPLRGGDRVLPEDVERRAAALGPDGAALARAVPGRRGAGRCWPRPTRSGSAAAWRSPRRAAPGVRRRPRPVGPRQRADRRRGLRDAPGGGDQGRRAREHAARAARRRASAPRPTASTDGPRDLGRRPRAGRRAGDTGL